jgi:hypothetical protein
LFSRGIWNILPIRPIRDQDWKSSIFGRDGTVNIAADWQITVFEGYGDIFLEDQTVFEIVMDFTEVTDLERHFEVKFQAKVGKWRGREMVQKV